MQFADNDGIRLAYERVGNRRGETIVFVEGLGYGRWMWRWQREALEEDFDIIIWDNRGTGESDEPDGPYTVPEMASDLEAVLADAGVDSAHIVGASMGGMITQQYALDYDRAASITLMCTTPGGPDEEPIPDETLNRMFNVPEDYDERESIRYKMEPAMTDSFWDANDDLIENIVDWRLEMDASDQAREWQAAGVELFDVSDRLDELTLPTLILHGQRDDVVPVGNGQMLADNIPEPQTFETFDEGGSHLFFVERSEAVSDRIRTFIAGN